MGGAHVHGRKKCLSGPGPEAHTCLQVLVLHFRSSMEFHQIQKKKKRRRGLQLDEEASAQRWRRQNAKIEHETEMLCHAARQKEASKVPNVTQDNFLPRKRDLDLQQGSYCAIGTTMPLLEQLSSEEKTDPFRTSPSPLWESRSLHKTIILHNWKKEDTSGAHNIVVSHEEGKAKGFLF